jgi:hypothetical protein
MKKTISRLVLAIALAVGTVAPAAAKIVSFGPKVGVAINKFSISQDAFSADNRVGFTGGLTADITLPVVGLGFDVSAMYVRRSADILEEVEGSTDPISKTVHNDFIDVPVHVKWKFGLPIIGNAVTPYIFTGPDFAFRAGKSTVDDIKSKTTDVSWDFGVGVQLMNHVQIGASYGLGLTKAIKTVSSDNNLTSFEGRTNCWTITAAYLF